MGFFYNFFKSNEVLSWILILSFFILLALIITFSFQKNEHQLSSNNSNLYIFYANWCGYCKSAMPAFQKLYNDYNNQTINNNKLSIQLLEGDQNQNLMKQFNVNSFPSIFLVSNGKRINYNGDRSYDDLVLFLRQNI